MKQGAFSIEFNSQFIALRRVARLIALYNLSIVELGTNFPGYNFNTVLSNGGLYEPFIKCFEMIKNTIFKVFSEYADRQECGLSESGLR